METWSSGVDGEVAVPLVANKKSPLLEAARSEIGQLTGAIKAQAIELAIVRGKAGWG
ncbi:MAG TPA: hypothetical protein VK988_05800 [Acidimicrobiales bacterium]|nr:hypothetical protein [Acidimicrobiales bacterium]